MELSGEMGIYATPVFLREKEAKVQWEYEKAGEQQRGEKDRKEIWSSWGGGEGRGWIRKAVFGNLIEALKALP